MFPLNIFPTVFAGVRVLPECQHGDYRRYIYLCQVPIRRGDRQRAGGVSNPSYPFGRRKLFRSTRRYLSSLSRIDRTPEPTDGRVWWDSYLQIHINTPQYLASQKLSGLIKCSLQNIQEQPQHTSPPESKQARYRTHPSKHAASVPGFPWKPRSLLRGKVYASDTCAAWPNRVLQVVSYDAPEVVVVAKEDSDKFDPTAKLVLYGGVVEASSAYELLWTQVTWARSGVASYAVYRHGMCD